MCREDSKRVQRRRLSSFPDAAVERTFLAEETREFFVLCKEYKRWEKPGVEIRRPQEGASFITF